VEGKEQEESAERRHRDGGRSKKSKTSDALTAEATQKPIRAAPAAEVTASVPQSTADMVAEAANELNAIKQTLKLWQKEFFELNGREPQRLDLTPDVLAMGERRDALKQILIQHDRADLASSKSSKSTPPKSAQRPTAGAALSANSLVAEAAPPTSQTPVNPTPVIVSTPAEAATVRSERATSSRSKRVSFIARGSAAEEDGGSASEAEAPTQPKQNAPLAAETVPAATSPTTAAVKVTAPAPASGPVAVVSESPVASVPIPSSQSPQPTAEELNKEYSYVKKALKSKQKAFFEEHGREPGDEDFDTLDEEFKELVVRKYELKAVLAEMGEEAPAAAASSKGKKSKKSSKASKHAADSVFD
jgi:hypothetical protein